MFNFKLFNTNSHLVAIIALLCSQNKEQHSSKKFIPATHFHLKKNEQNNYTFLILAMYVFLYFVSIMLRIGSVLNTVNTHFLFILLSTRFFSRRIRRFTDAAAFFQEATAENSVPLKILTPKPVFLIFRQFSAPILRKF